MIDWYYGISYDPRKERIKKIDETIEEYMETFYRKHFGRTMVDKSTGRLRIDRLGERIVKLYSTVGCEIFSSDNFPFFLERFIYYKSYYDSNFNIDCVGQLSTEPLIRAYNKTRKEHEEKVSEIKRKYQAEETERQRQIETNDRAWALSKEQARLYQAEADERVHQLRQEWDALQCNLDGQYTNEDAVTVYAKLIDLFDRYFPQPQTENFYARITPKEREDIERLLGIADYGHDYQKSEQIRRNVEKNYHILQAGKNGEARVTEILALYDDKVKFLLNYRFSQGNYSVEIDALVLAPNGIFSVEIKNYTGNKYILTETGWLEEINAKGEAVNQGKGKNIAFQSKQHLQNLRKLLRDCPIAVPDEALREILCFSNPKANVENHYPRITACYANELDNVILEARDRKTFFSQDDLAIIFDFLQHQCVPANRYRLEGIPKDFLDLFAHAVFSTTLGEKCYEEKLPVFELVPPADVFPPLETRLSAIEEPLPFEDFAKLFYAEDIPAFIEGEQRAARRNDLLG